MKIAKILSLSTVAVSLVLLVGCTTQTATNSNVLTNTNAADDNANVEAVTNASETVSNENTNTEQGSEIDTSDWLTYTNDEYGFGFKYPKEWELMQENNNKVIKLQSPTTVKEYDDWCMNYPTACEVGSDAFPKPDVLVVIEENNQNLSVKEWIQTNISEDEIIKQEDKVFGQNGYVYLKRDNMGTTDNYYIILGKNIIRVRMDFTDDMSNEVQKILTSLISS